MAVYAIVRLSMSDPSWVESYGPAVQAIVEANGGKYLVRNPEFDIVESNGEPPDVVVVMEFPSRDAFDGFYKAAEYQPWRESRMAGSNREFIVVEGL